MTAKRLIHLNWTISVEDVAEAARTRAGGTGVEQAGVLRASTWGDEP